MGILNTVQGVNIIFHSLLFIQAFRHPLCIYKLYGAFQVSTFNSKYDMACSSSEVKAKPKVQKKGAESSESKVPTNNGANVEIFASDVLEVIFPLFLSEVIQ